MRTPRNVIATAVTRWVEKGDPVAGKATQVKLVHIVEGRPPLKLDAWSTAGGIDGLVTSILECAQNHAAGGSGKTIQEEYNLYAYFGEDMNEGASTRFFIRPIGEVGDDDSPVGAYTEGANKSGQIHQGMRHLEAMMRISCEQISRNDSHTEVVVKRLASENDALRSENADLRAKINEAEDKSLERKLTIYRANNEEDRKNQLLHAFIPVASQLANAAVGAPLFPVDSDNAFIVKIKHFFQSLDSKKLESVLGSLDPQQQMIVMQIVQEINDAEKIEFARKQQAAQANVNGAPYDPKTIENLAKRSDGPPP